MTGDLVPATDFDRMPTIGDIPRLHAEVRPDKIAMSFEGRETSYRALNEHASRVANGLVELGVTRGRRIVYVGKNSDHYFELLLGAGKAGAVLTPVNWRLAPNEMGYIIRDAEAPVLFVGAELARTVLEALRELAHPPMVIAMEEVPGVEVTRYEPWRDAASSVDPMIPVGEDAIALQLYTSGTTGRPKGAMLSHRAMLIGRRLASEAGLPAHSWTANDISLVNLPVGHVGGTAWGVISLYFGAKAIITREFDPNTLLDHIEHDRLTKLNLVPSTLQIILRHPQVREVDYSCLKYINYGASPIPLDLLKESIEVFGCGFCQIYGMTETAGTIVYLPPGDHDPAGNPRMRSAGIAMPGVELRIVDGSGSPLPSGEVGEVMVRSVTNMSGYWNLPDATAAVLGEDGWLRTGDAGCLDEDGYLFIRDRVKDLIISGGENVYPAEVESAVYGHPAVAEVAVIGVPDPKWGEAVKAVVVLKEGHQADASDIIAFARSRIAKFKAPKSVDIVASLPRNASGKVLKRELRAPFWARHDRQVH